ncbi:MAG: hypothetical protein SF187_29160 [Deltaproteobacteria bacterium]|nr:hypothetical protein [Deltaproteobacteria bacterium]
MPALHPAFCILIVAACVTASGERARAAQPLLGFVRLHITNVDGQAGCITPEALRERIADRLGSLRGAHDDVTIDLDVNRATSKVWRINLATKLPAREPGGKAQEGQRSLTLPAATCAELLPPLAFIVTMMIDPEGRLASEPAKVVQPPTLPTNPPPWRNLLSLTAGASWGALPGSSALGLARWQGGPRERTNVAVTLAYTFNTTVFDGRGLPRRPSANFRDARLGVQVAQPLGRGLWGVAGVDCGVTTARGLNIDATAVDRNFGCGAGLGAVAVWPLSPHVALMFSGTGAVPWQQSRYVVGDASGAPVEVFRAAWLRFDASLGAAVAF